MNNKFNYEKDNFTLVPLDLPDNCKGTFAAMTNNDFESFKPSSISQLHTFNQNPNISRLNNLNQSLINPLNQDIVLNSNFSNVKGLIDTDNKFQRLDATNKILVKTLIVVKKSDELFN